MTTQQMVQLNMSMFGIFSGGVCTAFSAWGGQTVDGHTIAGRNYDAPGTSFPDFKGTTTVVVFNPVSEPGAVHRDNSVAIVAPVGMLFGLTGMNSKGLYFEYNNAMNSIPVDMTKLPDVADGLTQNFWAALDLDSLSAWTERYTKSKSLSASLTGVADEKQAQHYERSPYQNSRMVQSASGGDYKYANMRGMDIYTNHFFLTDWENQVFPPFGKCPPTCPATYDAPTQTFQRLINLQNQAAAAAGRIDVGLMKSTMTTPIANGGSFVPLNTSSNPGWTSYTTVTDVRSKVMYIWSQLESPTQQWVTVDLNRFFKQ